MGRARRLFVGVVAVAAGLGVVGAPVPALAAEGPRVLMVDNDPDLTRWHFEPADVTVPAGTTVVWFNKGKQEHSVTADDKSFDSGLKGTGGTFSRAFPRPGKFSYYCAPHPWMKGTVEVVAGAPTPRTAAAAAPNDAAATTTTAAPPTAATSPASSPGPPPAGPPPSADSPTTTVAGGSPEAPPESNEDAAAAPASNSDGSGDPLAGTLALVLLPTLGALALGAKLRQSRS